jgi:hypothetical protein
MSAFLGSLEQAIHLTRVQEILAALMPVSCSCRSALACSTFPISPFGHHLVAHQNSSIHRVSSYHTLLKKRLLSKVKCAFELCEAVGGHLHQLCRMTGPVGNVSVAGTERTKSHAVGHVRFRGLSGHRSWVPDTSACDPFCRWQRHWSCRSLAYLDERVDGGGRAGGGASIKVGVGRGRCKKSAGNSRGSSQPQWRQSPRTFLSATKLRVRGQSPRCSGFRVITAYERPSKGGALELTCAHAGTDS